MKKIKPIGMFLLGWAVYVFRAVGHAVKACNIFWEDRNYSPVDDDNIPEPPRFEYSKE